MNIILVLFMLALIGGIILVVVLYLLNLQRLLQEISSSNRLVEPGNVWLMFIPLFNLIYPFILYPRICDSVRNEYQSRGMSEDGDFGRAIGITMPVLGLCGWLPYIGAIAGIANLVLFIIFWVKMAGYRTKLKSAPKGAGQISHNPDILD